MAEGTPQLKEEALATLQAGRREISAEAKWIKRTLSPKHAAEELMEKHPLSVLSVAFGIGVALAYRLSAPRKKHFDLPDVQVNQADENAGQVAKAGVTLYLLTTALKTAAPYLMKQGLRIIDQRAYDAAKAENRPVKAASVSLPLNSPTDLPATPETVNPPVV